jgi:uncharacterized membrane protein
MTPIILYIITLVLFLGLDFVGLTYLIKPEFERHIGDLLLDRFRVVPAFVFYAFFVGVVLWFVSLPAMEQGRSLWWVLGNAALLGALGYGTYEFTSYAVMKDWSFSMVATDFIWGTCLTAVTAMGGVWIVRSFS